MERVGPTAIQEEIELSSFSRDEKQIGVKEDNVNQTRRDEEVMATMAQATDGDGELIHNVQTLAPVDGGRQAWTFCFCAFLLETIVWGFGFR